MSASIFIYFPQCKLLRAGRLLLRYCSATLAHAGALEQQKNCSLFGILNWLQSLSWPWRTRTCNELVRRLLDLPLLSKNTTEARGAHLPGSARSVLPRFSPALGRRYAHVALLLGCSLPHVTCREIRALRACPGSVGCGHEHQASTESKCSAAGACRTF